MALDEAQLHHTVITCSASPMALALTDGSLPFSPSYRLEVALWLCLLHAQTSRRTGGEHVARLGHEYSDPGGLRRVADHMCIYLVRFVAHDGPMLSRGHVGHPPNQPNHLAHGYCKSQITGRIT